MITTYTMSGGLGRAFDNRLHVGMWSKSDIVGGRQSVRYERLSRNYRLL